MSHPVYVFDLRGVYVFAPEDDGPLPPTVRSQYNGERERYELPTKDLLEELRSTVGEVNIVEDTERFTVAFPGDAPDDVLEDAVHVEWHPGSTQVLLPRPELVERAVAAGGERVASGEG